MSKNIFFMPIKPPHVANILDGSKTVELRRRIPSIEIGDVIVIYSTRPECCVVGFALVRGVIKKAPTELWPFVESRAQVEMNKFENYFKGAREGVAIFLYSLRILKKKVGLSTLRKIVPGFTVPMSYRFLSRQEFNQILLAAKYS